MLSALDMVRRVAADERRPEPAFSRRAGDMGGLYDGYRNDGTGRLVEERLRVQFKRLSDLMSTPVPVGCRFDNAVSIAGGNYYFQDGDTGRMFPRGAPAALKMLWDLVALVVKEAYKNGVAKGFDRVWRKDGQAKLEVASKLLSGDVDVLDLAEFLEEVE